MHISLLLLCVGVVTAGQNSYGDEMNQPSGISCANVRCASGTMCVENNGKPQCMSVQQEAGLSCKTLLCGMQYRCEEQASGATCVKVDNSLPPTQPEPLCNLIDCKSGLICVETSAGDANCVQPSTSVSNPGGGYNGEHPGHNGVDTLNCGENEEVNQCGNLCEPNCFNSAPTCIEICNPPACVCKKGYLRDTFRKMCVTSSGCPQISPPDDGMNPGNPPAPPPPPPPMDQPNYDPCIATTCPVGSICKPKQVFCIKAPCPPIGECVLSMSCKTGEVYNECGNHCDQTCDNPLPFCTLQCGPPACACMEGYARVSKGGQCVPMAQCKPTKPSGGYRMRRRRV